MLAEKGRRGSAGAGVWTTGCMRSLVAGTIRSVVRRDPPLQAGAGARTHRHPTVPYDSASACSFSAAFIASNPRRVFVARPLP